MVTDCDCSGVESESFPLVSITSLSRFKGKMCDLPSAASTLLPRLSPSFPLTNATLFLLRHRYPDVLESPDFICALHVYTTTSFRIRRPGSDVGAPRDPSFKSRMCSPLSMFASLIQSRLTNTISETGIFETTFMYASKGITSTSASADSTTTAAEVRNCTPSAESSQKHVHESPEFIFPRTVAFFTFPKSSNIRFSNRTVPRFNRNINSFSAFCSTMVRSWATILFFTLGDLESSVKNPSKIIFSLPLAAITTCSAPFHPCC
mmetsp:Transcript_29048/g.81270  ORF Transcript_29048/g.81270 Transcript_29048/m.81270 type:complete len:263 (-) Transcript_29048:31-819(-)